MSKAWTSSTAMLHVGAAATLAGLEAPPPHVVFEVKPYALIDTKTDRLVRPAITNDLTGDAGVDVKIGVTKAMTADLTYRTDFAQVEDDEAQVNLTRFALSFPEKREFFLEGAGIFTSFGSAVPSAVSGSGSDAPSLFYSRRIGLAGARAVPILGGGRLTGKVEKWTVGALDIQAEDDPLSGTRETNFAVLRVRRDVGRRSTVGAMGTSRSVSASGSGNNQMYGADGTFTFSRMSISLVTWRAPARRGWRERTTAIAATSVTPATCTACWSIAWRWRTTSTRRLAFCDAARSAARSAASGSAHGRSGGRRSASIISRTASSSHQYG